MLSFVACYSICYAIPVYLAVPPGDHLFVKRRSRSQPKLRGLAVLIVVLAIDFALLRFVSAPYHRPLLYASDVAVVLIPVIYAVLAKHAIWELWFIMSITGLIGILTLEAFGMSGR